MLSYSSIKHLTEPKEMYENNEHTENYHSFARTNKRAYAKCYQPGNNKTSPSQVIRQKQKSTEVFFYQHTPTPMTQFQSYC